jgi:aspartate kinase
LSRIVQKFGGSSVADAESIKRVARRIADTRADGHEVMIVISAMGDTTDELLELAHRVSPKPNARELDMLLTTGERQSAALLAMALTDLGVAASSYTGSQAGVITTNQHGDARILDITPQRVIDAMSEGDVAIVAGFQGVARETKDITTLGRGASDTTAVALAAAIHADFCEIYTDVDGIFTADPRVVPAARQIPKISYEEMLELAASGAKVLHLRCVEYARAETVPIHVRSSFSYKPGTWVVDQSVIEAEGGNMEQAVISGVAHDTSEAKVTVVGVPDQIGRAAKLFGVIAAKNINIDMIVQNISKGEGRTDISFTAPMGERERAVDALNLAKAEIGFEDIVVNDAVGKVSIVGVGMRSHPGVTYRFFDALAQAGVNIDMISTSEIRISVVVAVDDVKAAVRAAHTAFGLDAEAEAVVYAGTGR